MRLVDTSENRVFTMSFSMILPLTESIPINQLKNGSMNQLVPKLLRPFWRPSTSAGPFSMYRSTRVEKKATEHGSVYWSLKSLVIFGNESSL